MAEQFDTIIRGGTVVNGSGMARADVGIRGEVVATVAPDLDTQGAANVIDATGKYVMPGVIDVHTHPVYLDDLGGISVTAAHGGVTTMIHYAYARPGNKLMDIIAQYKRDGGEKSVVGARSGRLSRPSDDTA